MRARFVILANGILTTPKLARIEGMETFEGESFHTSRWNYDVDLDGKRVGIIGTGATAVQAIPELAKVAGELYVFQRTPSTIDVRDQRGHDARRDRRRGRRSRAGRRARRARFAKISAGRTAIKANDDYLAGKVADFKERKQHEPRADARGADRRSSSTRTSGSWSRSARGSTPSSRTRDRCGAQAVLPVRLQAADVPRRVPADVQPAPRPPGRHRAAGRQRDQRERRRARRRRVPARRADLRHRVPVDGDLDVQHDHRAATAARSARSGARRARRTFLGLHSHGFPNLFIMTGPQGGGGSFNFTDAIDAHADYIVWMLSTMRDRGADVVDVDQATPRRSTPSTAAQADIATAPLRDCLSYYNGHGDAEPGSLAYYGGRGWQQYRRPPRRRCALRVREPFRSGSSGPASVLRAPVRMSLARTGARAARPAAPLR